MNSNEGFSVITVTCRPYFIDRLIKNFLTQQFDNKELIVIINNDNISIEQFDKYTCQYDNIRVYTLPQKATLGYCLNFAANKSNYYYIAKFDDDDYYGKLYLLEMYNAFKTSKCHIIGKSKLNYYLEEYRELRRMISGIENNYVGWIGGPTICFTKDLFKVVQFKNITLAEDINFINDCRKRGYKIYSTSINNHILFRARDISTHTWKVKSEELYRSTIKIKENIEFYESFIFVDQ